MGGHTYVDNFATMEEVVRFWRTAIIRYQYELGLWLSFGQITFQEDIDEQVLNDKPYKVSMRFVK